MRSKDTSSHQNGIFVSSGLFLHLLGSWFRSAVTPGVKWHPTKTASSDFYGSDNVFPKAQKNHTK